MTDSRQPTVHLVFSSEGLSACERRRLPTEPVVLLADAVYAAATAIGTGSVKVIAEDLKLRGLSPKRLPPRAVPIDYADLVTLIASGGPTVSWH